MAFSVTQRVISSEDMIYSYCDDFCRKAKLLYNAALFRIRNIFTGYEKEHRTDNEEDIFCEVHALQDVHPQIHVRKVISYNHLEKLKMCIRDSEMAVHTLESIQTGTAR